MTTDVESTAMLARTMVRWEPCICGGQRHPESLLCRKCRRSIRERNAAAELSVYFERLSWRKAS